MAIVIPLVTDFDDRGVKKAQKAFKNFDKAAGDLGKQLKSVFLPVGVAIAGATAAAVNFAHAAMEDQQSAALLARQLKATTKATDEQVAAVEDWILKTSLAVGVADDQLRPAFAKIVRVVKDTTKAQKLLNIGLDVAKGTGKSLDQVMTSIARAYGGNVKALARLDPGLKSFITKTTSADAAVQRLAQTYAGQATAAADTFQGRMDRAKIAMQEAKETIGYALLPYLERLASWFATKVAPAIQHFVDSVQKNGLKKAIEDAGRSFGTFVQEADGWKGVIIDLTGTVLALGVAVKGLLIVNSVAGAFKAASGAFSALGGVFEGITITASTMAGIFASVLATVYLLVDTLRSSDRPAFLDYILNTLKLIANIVPYIANLIVDALNPLIEGYNKFAAVTPFTPTIPTLSKMPTFSYSGLGQMEQSRSFSGARQFEETPINVNINTGIGDPVAIGREVDNVLKKYLRRGGGY